MRLLAVGSVSGSMGSRIIKTPGEPGPSCLMKKIISLVTDRKGKIILIYILYVCISSLFGLVKSGSVRKPKSVNKMKKREREEEKWKKKRRGETVINV